MFLRTLRRRSAPIAVFSAVSVLAALVPRHLAQAQSTTDSTDVTPPAHGVGGPSTLGKPLPSAGSADALVTADPSTGAAHAFLPFDLPTARGHAQPSLTLNYDSSAGPGAGGVGWSLNLPAIERRNSSGFPRFIDGAPGPPGADPTKDPDDFVFAGEPLVPICVISAQGACSADAAITDLAIFAGYTYFRTERDNFTRFFYSAGHTEWVVQSQSGAWMYFGETSGDASALETHDVDVTADATTLIYRWNLSRIVDEAGNAVLYKWAALDSTDDGFAGGDQPTNATGSGLKYLTDIYDTPTTNISRATPALTDYAHHTQIFWRGTDGTRQYSPGWKSIYARVIGDVAVTSKTFTAQSERAIVRLYHLDYSAEAQNAQRYLGAFELHACTQTKSESNGVVADPVTWAYTATDTQGMACPMVNPTSMLYTPLPSFSPTLVRTYNVNPPLVTGAIQTGMFDVNGDGVSDLVASANAPGYVGPNSRVNPSGTIIPFALVIDDGVTGAPLLNVPYQAPLTGPLWAQPPDFLPSAHTALGNWVGDGQLNWLWFDGVPMYWDSNAPVGDPGPAGTSETYSLSAADAGSLVAVGPPPTAGTRASPYPTPCPAPFICGPDNSPDGVVGTEEEDAEWNWQRGKGFDVDGDGLDDMAFVPQVPIQQNTEGTTQPTYFTYQAKNGQITPYLRRIAQPAPAGYDMAGFHAVADMDGDGLDDIIQIIRVAATSGFDVDMTWWKNRGDGRFGLGSPGYFTDFVFGGADGTAQTVDPQQSNIAVGDVTGDGLADVVALRSGTLYVYAQPTVAAYDPLKGFTLLGSIPHAAADDNAVVALADIDGSGMLGVVVTDVTKVSLYQLFPSVPRPGLLSSMQAPHRAGTQVQYQSVAALSQNASAANNGWQTKLPAPAQVVVDIKSSGLFVGPGGTSDVYETKYTYTDPIYDARDQAFVGFRVVEEDRLGSVPGAPQMNTVTTYIPATCLRVSPGQPCATGIDYGWHIRRGLPVIVQESDASSGTLLSTTTTSWAYRRTYWGLDGRAVRMVYPAQVDEYDGEPSAAPSTGTPISGLYSQADETDTAWEWTGTTTIPGSSVDRRTTRQVDLNGHETVSAAWGTVGIDTPIVTLRTWQVVPGDASQWLYRVSQTLVGYGDSSAETLPQGGRESDFQYDSYGRLTATLAPLTGSAPLYRSNPGGSTAPTPPPGASVNTAPGALRTFASYTYDDYGNVTTVEGPSGRCSGTTYDSVYNELPVAESAYRGGCGNSPLTTALTWDRGLEKITQQVDPGSAVTTWKYDPYGRLVEMDQPSAEALGMTSSAALLVDWSNADQGNQAGYSIHVTTLDHDSYVVFDNFGRARYRLDQAETAGSWIVSGGAELAATGNPLKAYVPFEWSGSPSPTTGGPPAIPFTGNSASYSYDAFGRALVVTGPDGAVVANVTYHPLKTDVLDGDQTPGGPHAGSYTESAIDGRGVPVSTTQFSAKDPADAVTTAVTRLATGEIAAITQSHTAASDTYTRWMEYDSLGRLTVNFEPNTSARVGMGTFSELVGWRYAYDDAGDLVGTSDSRGCGENLVYDSLGRLTNEDYSPCTPGQAEYSSGYETFFTYDTAPSAFAGSLGDSAGKLTSWGDRGSQTQINYGPRGRAVGVVRQLAAPNTTGTDLPFASRYAPHAFERIIDYDDANRVATSTTGVDAAALGVSLPSLTNHYTPRGTIGSIDGTYGTLLKSIAFNPDGTPQQEVLGDVAGTTVDFGYWPNSRLKTAHVHRAAGPWSSATGYAPPTSAQPNTLEDDLENVLVTYDGVGNPLSIVDSSTAHWPAGALPASPSMTYDDNYRLRSVSTTYGPSGGGDSFSFPPYVSGSVADEMFPPLAPGVSTRVQNQGVTYDWLGNTTSSSDDQNAFADRSLGTITNGSSGAGPHQIRSAALGGSSATTAYDASGNLLSLHVVRAPPCESQCNTTYAYTWDELGQLSSASRSYATPPLQRGLGVQPLVMLDAKVVTDSFVYGADGRRALTATATNQGTTYSADVYDSLRIEGATFPDPNGDYERTDQTQAVLLTSAGMRLGRIVYSATDPQAPPDMPKEYVFLEVGDRLGSTSFVIDQATSEIVERPTYQAYGAAESDFRTARWSNFRETTRYTGHEDDAEVGLVYFGHRFYSPLLSRWVSPDPLTIHALGGDVNPYAFVGGSPFGFVDPTGLDECDSSKSSCSEPPPPLPTCLDSSCGEEGGSYSSGSNGTGTPSQGPGPHGEEGDAPDVVRQYGPPPPPSQAAASGNGSTNEIRPTRWVLRLEHGEWVSEETSGSVDVRLPAGYGRGEQRKRLWSASLMLLSTVGVGEVLAAVEEAVALGEAASAAREGEGIYEFSTASGKTYVGQSGDIAARLEQHLESGKLLEPDLSTVETTEVQGGKLAREIAEQQRIDQLGGVQALENIRNPIGPARRYLMPEVPDITIDEQ
jgi:RHS repeat-associated protein